MKGRAIVAMCGLCVSGVVLGGPPAKYYQEDTVAMVRLDLGSITVDNAKAAMDALVTQADLDAIGSEINLERDVMPQVNQIGMMQMMTMGLTGNGASVVSVAVRTPTGGMDGQPQMSVLLPASSEQGAEQILSFINQFAGQIPGGLGTATEMSGDEHWVVITPPGGAAPEGPGSAARREALTGAIESVGEQTLSIGFVPSEHMIEQMIQNVNDEQGEAMVSTIMKADWMGLWLSVDGTPELGVRMKYSDSELAGRVEELYAGALALMISQAQEADAQLEDAPAEFKPSVIAGKLAEWLGMEREGEVCTIKLDPGELRALTLLSIEAGPMLEQNPMFGEFMRRFQQNMPMN